MDPHHFMESRFEKHGPIFKTHLFGKPTACFVSPEAWEVFLDERFVAREGGTPPHIAELLGVSTLPFVDGEGHRRNKTMLLEAFKPDPMRGYIPEIAPIFDRRFSSWARQQELHAFPEIEKLTLTVFNRLLAGMDPYADYDDFQFHLVRFMAGIQALPSPVPFGAYQRAARSRDWLLEYLLILVRARRAQPGPEAISHMIAAKDQAGQTLSDEEIAAELLHVYFAGYATIGASFGYALVALAKHPEVRGKLEAEMAEHQSELGTFEGLQKLTYSSQFFKEIMRFYPTVPQTFFGRVVAPIKIHGYNIPVGWKAAGVVGASLFDRNRFKAPNAFDPARFGPERGEDQPSAYTFVPQGGGPPEGHRCLGESLSVLAMKVFLTRLVPNYEWELTEEPGLKRTFPPSPQGGLPIRFYEKTP